MQNCETAIDVTIKKACEDIVSERVALFSESDVSDIEISDEAVKRFVKYLRRVLFRESSAFRMLKNTAIAFLIVVGVVLCSTVLIEPIRAYVWEIIFNYHEDHIEVQFNDEEVEASAGQKDKIYCPNLPTEWKVELGDPDIPDGIQIITTPDNERIFFSQIVDEGFIGFDEDKTVKEITMRNGQKAYFMDSEDGFLSLVWKKEKVFILHSYEKDESLLLYVAERIK